MKYLATIAVILVSLFIGFVITSLDIENSFYLFGIGAVLISLLVGKVNYRNQNYVGVIFTTKKELAYKLTSKEKLFGWGALVLMASPFIYMLGMTYLM